MGFFIEKIVLKKSLSKYESATFDPDFELYKNPYRIKFGFHRKIILIVPILTLFYQMHFFKPMNTPQGNGLKLYFT